MALLYGWSRETWSSGPGPWSQPAPLVVTGVQAAAEVGSAAFPKTVEVTGVGAASAIGTSTVVTNAILSATGVQGAGGIGSVTVSTENIFGVTGVEAVGAINDVGTGVSFRVTGVEAQGLVTTPNIWSVVDTTQNANWVPIAA